MVLADRPLRDPFGIDDSPSHGLNVGIAVLAVVAFAVAVRVRPGPEHEAVREAIRTGAAPHREVDGTLVAVLEADTALACAVPGRTGGVLVSTGLADRLRADELGAVVAHERAHLRQHHAAVVGFAESVERAVPWVPGARAMARSTRVLVEFAAGRTPPRAGSAVTPSAGRCSWRTRRAHSARSAPPGWADRTREARAASGCRRTGASLVRSATARGTVQPLTESDIRSSFVNATPDRTRPAPDPGAARDALERTRVPRLARPAGRRRGYMVSWMDGEPVGIVVRAAGGSLRPGIAAMCSFCHSPQPATQVRLFSAARGGEAGRNGNTIGSYICEDLGCSMLIRTAPPHLNPPATIAMRSESLLARVHSFTADIKSTA